MQLSDINFKVLVIVFILALISNYVFNNYYTVGQYMNDKSIYYSGYPFHSRVIELNGQTIPVSVEDVQFYETIYSSSILNILVHVLFWITIIYVYKGVIINRYKKKVLLPKCISLTLLYIYTVVGFLIVVITNGNTLFDFSFYWNSYMLLVAGVSILILWFISSLIYKVLYSVLSSSNSHKK